MNGGLSTLLTVALAVLMLGGFGAVAQPAGAEPGVDELGVDEDALSSASTPLDRLSDVACKGGSAGPFRCRGIDLLSFVPLDEIRPPDEYPVGKRTFTDLWGWTDPLNSDEYVIVGETNGVAFFRVTDATSPVYLGDLSTTAVHRVSPYDVKVYKDHVFVVSESTPHGMRVFDLRRLRGVTEPRIWTEDARYPLVVSAHNVAVNEETGFAYIVGADRDLCGSGLHMVDIRDPKLPAFAGCYADDGYIHDTQCVVYDGPDSDYRGRELCFNSSVDNVSIVDVTDKRSPTLIASFSYPGVRYAHQGWLNQDQRYFLLNDESDERGSNPTRTLVFDVADLDSPRLHFEKFHKTTATDHNLYTNGRLVYESNYSAGLRVLDTQYLDEREMEEVAYFDTLPASDGTGFGGSFSNYPFFSSGTIAVSSMREGLFLLRLKPDVLAELAEKDERRTAT